LLINFCFQGEQNSSPDMEQNIISKYDESEKEDEESSTTGPTVQELTKNEQTTGKDTDEDASFSESEQTPLRSSKSDKQQQSTDAIQTTDESLSLSLNSTNEIQDSDKNLSRSTESLNNEINELELELQSIDSEEKYSKAIIDREVKFLEYYLMNYLPSCFLLGKRK